VEDADVPEARFVTGRLPVTPVESGNPVQLVSVPDEGIPRTPPLTTGAPAVPTFTARAVATPVPSPDIPVDTGRPVRFVAVPLDGVPSAPHCTTIVLDASGRVKVFSAVVGQENFVNPFPVPP